MDVDTCRALLHGLIRAVRLNEVGAALNPNSNPHPNPHRKPNPHPNPNPETLNEVGAAHRAHTFCSHTEAR